MTHTAQAKILVFDSGVGGLSILQALQQVLPGCAYIYASDNAAFPYGTKSPEYLISRVDTVLQVLIEKTQPDLIVVACNTASTLVLPHIRQRFVIPIVGVVPAIKPAAMQSMSGVIGLLGTPGTITRAYTKDLLETFAGHCEVISAGSSELVVIAESALRGKAPCQQQLRALLKPFFEHPQLDTIVLACTHFPLIKDQLIKAAPRPVDWVDSGSAIARRVKSILASAPLKERSRQTAKNAAIFTAQSRDVESLHSVLQQFKLTDMVYIEV